MKWKTFLLFFWITISHYNAQNFGNEWIDYNQQYFHFPITQTGIHRLSYSVIDDALTGLGLNMSNIPNTGFQLFGREKEISILIHDNDNNGFLDTNDYVEFYAEKNDGWLDNLVYDSIEYQTNPYYSLFNDTIRYYFTWNNGFNNKRTLIETDTNYQAYNSNPFCWKTSIVNYNSDYVLGEQESGISSPKYEIGEGWAGSRHQKNGNYTENINTSNYYSSGPNAVGATNISVTNSSYSNAIGDNHNTKLYVNNNLVYDSSFYGYKMLHIDFEIDANGLTNTTAIKHNIANIGQGTDYQHISFISIAYPHQLDFSDYNELVFGIPYQNNQKSRLTISNMINGSPNPKLYMFDDLNRIIPLTPNAGNWEAVLPPPSGDTSLFYLFDESNNIEVSTIYPVNNNGYFNDYESLQLDSAFLIITHKKLLTSSRSYASYRANNYDTLVIDVNELYHQFSGGIYKNPLSIKRFLSLTMNKWPSWPSHLFLIGKSVRFNTEFSPGSRNDTTSYAMNLVPSWGCPSSDNHLGVGLGSGKRGSPIAIGRRSVLNNNNVNKYLNKVVELENNQGSNSPYTITNKEWQKNIAHFAGGSDSTQQAYMNGWLNIFKNIIEDTLYGGKVKTFGKDPFSSIINPFEFQEVQNYLEDGISLMTFFGHASSGGGFSQNIDQPENWNNQGKYPLVIGLGCYSGDVHNPDTNSFSEQIVLPDQSGAIGFISTVKQGFIPFINHYTEYLYKIISYYGYEKTIGQQMVMAIDSLDQNTLNYYWSPKFESNYNGMTLQGDPAIKLNTHLSPEIVLNPPDIWTTPNVIDLAQDSFLLNVIVYNLGKAFDDSIYMEIKQNFPNGTDTIYSKMIAGVKNKDTIIFTLITSPEKSIGENIFDISIDLPISFIIEAEDETNNNQTQYIINISSNSIIPVWPYDFSIIGDNPDTLRVSTLNPLEPSNTYYFEIDTTNDFNSTFLKTQSTISIGGVIEAYPNDWINFSTGINDPLSFTDSSVYYWRCRPDSTVIDWKESSFQFIPNKWGWGQAHFNQFENNDFINISYNKPNRTYDFLPTLKTIYCKNYIQHIGLSSEWNGTLWQVNGSTADYGGYLYPAVVIGVVDPITLDFWRTPYINNSVNPPLTLNPNNCFGQFNGDPAICNNTSLMGRSREHGFFVFNSNSSTQLDSLATFLENKIPNDHYIIAYSYIINNYGSWQLYTDSLYTNWPNSLFSAFQNLGSTGFINQTQPDDGFIFFCQKGDPSSAQEIRSNPISPGMGAQSQALELNATITSSLESGYITSPHIGPSQNWKSIYWRQKALESPTNDSSRLRLYGIVDPTINQKTLLIDTLFNNNDSIINIQNVCSNYPYLQLEMETLDDSALTPAQIRKWQIIYNPLPELAINPKKGLYFSFDSTGIQQGDSGEISVAIENISPFNMDSLLVYYTIKSSNNSDSLGYPRQDSLKARQILLDTISFTTKQLNDDCEFWINANPIVNLNEQDQPEQFYFNNFLQKNFSVYRDVTNPLLDVTFDGIHILNQDIVSPNPHIVIELDDENPFMLLDETVDTSNFQIDLFNPNSNTWKRINFNNSQGDPILEWEFIENENKVIIQYDPVFNEDGIYSLKVQGQDKSGNLSGDEAYQIQFEVIQNSTITNIYNYPNPFSTKTHFVYTLTGSDIPDEVTIQILTINGDLIKQIHLHEHENMKIGHNVTEYYWDGKDDFGDPLANGIYLYRVIATINNQNIEHRESAGDHAYTKGFGKMYLIR